MRAHLLTGTVTFLFTDVEGSTKLLHELGAEAYAAALAEHRRVLREACSSQGGVEVDTQGDAFFFAFPTAPGALAAAQQATDALSVGPIHVRIGLHTGTPLVTEEGYIGDDVHLGARVAACSHGGQVVLSSATAELVEFELVDLGEHRFKDIRESVSIFQLGEGSFPPLKTISNTNLPRPASSFVGREAELTEVLAKIEAGARLVTLTGPGGSGKTRLAIEAAASLVPEFKAGVFWVGLAALRDPALVTETIAQALGAKDALPEHIGERELLLLLDNLEQVIDAAPELSTLLSACPNLTLLVTSRELLRVRGEVEYPVPPLAQPEAVALFCERGQLEPSEEIAELCARLDSLPLAVELAAARTKALSPVQILERLSQRLDLFKGGRDADPRQQTLRATIEWSYELLSSEEQRLFARLAVFAGGCTLEAAEEVAEADLDTLQSLVEKSLLRFTTSDAGSRYWMLETIREYAADRLGAAERRAAHAALSKWVLRLASASRMGFESSEQQVWIERLHAEQGNLREVLLSALEVGEAEQVLRIVAALSRYYWERQPGEALMWLERGLTRRSAVPKHVEADALCAAGELEWFLGRPSEALDRFQEAHNIFEEFGDAEGVARVLTRLGPPLWESGRRDEAETVLAHAAMLHRQHGQLHELALTLSIQGVNAMRRGDPKAARDLLDSALSLARELGDLALVLNVLINLAENALDSGDHPEAERLAREALELSHSLAEPISRLFCLTLFAWLARERRDLRQAAILWGAVERLDSELGETMWRNERDLYEARVGSDVLGDHQGLAEGRLLEVEKAVQYALASIG
jgi:predicted ATPase